MRLQHPYLYFAGDDIPSLKEKLKHPWMAKKWQTFLRRGELLLSAEIYREPSKDLSFGASTMAVGEGSCQFLRRVPLLAFLYLMTEDSRYLRKAKEHLLDACSWRVWGGYDVEGRPDPGLGAGLFGMSVAMVYDWLFDELSEPERRQVRDALSEKTARPYCQKYLVDEPTAMPGPEINWPAQWFVGVGLAGLVLWDEVPEARQWVKHAEDVMRGIIWGNDPDGGGHEGPHYINYMSSNVLLFADALRRVTGTNLFDAPFLKNMSKYCLSCTYERPDDVWQVNFSDTQRSDLVRSTKKAANPTFLDWSFVAYGLVAVCLAREYKDKQAMWLYGIWLDRIDPKDKILGETWNFPMEIIWFDQTVQPEPPDVLPLSRHFRGIGWIFSRSGWKPSDTLFAFKNGRGRWWHIHGDVNHFILWADGEQLITDPGMGPYVYQDTEEERLKAGELMEKIQTFYRVTGHNALIVDGEGQLADPSTSNHRWHGREAGRAESIEQGGRVLDFIDGGFGMYLKADGAGPYYARLRTWNRHIFSAGLRYLVVYDEVECNGKRGIELTLHTPKGLLVNGRTAVLVKDGRELMTISVLMAEKMIVQGKEGYGEGLIWITPEENPQKVSPHELMPKADFLSVESPGKVQQAHFLNVIDVHRDGRRSTQAVESITGDGFHGLKIHESGHASIALFRVGPGDLEYEGLRTNAGFVFMSLATEPKRILVSEADFLDIQGVQYLRCDRPVTVSLEYHGGGFTGHVKATTRVYLKLHVPSCPRGITIDGKDVEFEYDSPKESVLFMVHRGTFDVAGTRGTPGEKPKYLKKFPAKREIIF